MTTPPWAPDIPDAKWAHYRRRHTPIAHTEARGITVRQLHLLSELISAVLEATVLIDKFRKLPITQKSVNMYNICAHFVMPLTADERCSFVELVEDEVKPPQWFVSHAWSTAFLS